MNTVSKFLTVTELAAHLRMDPESLRSKCRNGTFPIKPVRTGGKKSPLLFVRSEVVAHFRAEAGQAKAELDLFEALQTAGGLTREKAAEVVYALHTGEISHDDVKAALASRVA